MEAKTKKTPMETATRNLFVFCLHSLHRRINHHRTRAYDGRRHIPTWVFQRPFVIV